MWFLLLILVYAVLFVIVVWPIHWLWHSRTQEGPYDTRFYNQASFWRIYAWIFGTAIAAAILMNIVRGVW